MDYKQYELLVKEYLERKLLVDSLKIEVKHQGNIQTPTGRSYNIDLSYELRVGGMTYVTIVECKCWKKNVSRDELLAIHAKAIDLNAHKVIAVTTKGFQKGALEYAKEKGIGLIKMTTDKNVEHFFSYNGLDLSKIMTALMTETDLTDEQKITDGIELIYPRQSVRDYLLLNFGCDVIDALERFNNCMDEFEYSKSFKQDIILIEKIPFDWNKNYSLIQSSGLVRSFCRSEEHRVYESIINTFHLLFKNKTSN